MPLSTRHLEVLWFKIPLATIPCQQMTSSIKWWSNCKKSINLKQRATSTSKEVEKDTASTENNFGAKNWERMFMNHVLYQILFLVRNMRKINICIYLANEILAILKNLEFKNAKHCKQIINNYSSQYNTFL